MRSVSSKPGLTATVAEPILRASNIAVPGGCPIVICAAPFTRLGPRRFDPPSVSPRRVNSNYVLLHILSRVRRVRSASSNLHPINHSERSPARATPIPPLTKPRSHSDQPQTTNQPHTTTPTTTHTTHGFHPLITHIDVCSEAAAMVGSSNDKDVQLEVAHRFVGDEKQRLAAVGDCDCLCRSCFPALRTDELLQCLY